MKRKKQNRRQRGGLPREGEKARPRAARLGGLLLAVALLLGSITHGQAATPSANMSPGDACDFISSWLVDWERVTPLDQPGPAPKPDPNTGRPGKITFTRAFPPAAVQELATQLQALGIHNLLAIDHAVTHAKGGPDVRSRLLLPAYAQAFQAIAKPDDLPEMLKAAADQPSLFPLLLSCPQLKDDPRITSAVSDAFDRLLAGGYDISVDAPAPPDELVIDATDPNENGAHVVSRTNDGALKTDNADAARPLLLAAGELQNPVMEDKVDKYMQALIQAKQFNVNLASELFVGFVQSKDAATARYVPGLMQALAEHGFNAEIKAFRTDNLQQLLDFCFQYPKVCGDPLFPRAMNGFVFLLDGRGIDELSLKEALMAVVGDRSSFDHVVLIYRSTVPAPSAPGSDLAGDVTGDHKPATSSLRDNNGNPLPASSKRFAQEVLEHVNYHGPEPKIDNIIAHIDDCKFDPATGQWTLTVQ